MGIGKSCCSRDCRDLYPVRRGRQIGIGLSVLSPGFILWYGLEILILGIYAILWQQIIKRFDLSVAYANRSIALLWSMLWAVCCFMKRLPSKT